MIALNEEAILNHEHEKLSIIIPVYNEEKTLLESYKKVKQVDFPIGTEIIIIDDCSKDKSPEIIESIKRNDKNVISYRNPVNMGKGASVAKGLSLATGTILTIHDADLEYDPNDLNKLLNIMLTNRNDVIFGNRPFNLMSKKVYISNVIGNFGLSCLASLVYMKPLLDIETCYKMFRREVIQGINLESKRFDFEIEITAKLARSGHDIHFHKISYNPRNYVEGKKIKWMDGVIALGRILKYRFVKFRDKEEFLEPIFRRFRVRKVLRLIPSKTILLDVGCGADFKFLRSIKKFIKIGVGVDVRARDSYHDNLCIVGHKLGKNLPFEDSRFNVVTMLAVLEHLDYPEDIIRESYRVLKEGGKLLMTIPSKRSKRLLEFLSYKLNIVSKAEIRDHKNYFAKRKIIQMLEKTKFKNITVKTYNLGMNYFIVGEK
jgi:glycosyltransferase involved in cell wall biosynthesis